MKGWPRTGTHGPSTERRDPLCLPESRAGFPLTIESRATGLAKRSWIKISQIRTLSSDRIGARLARASEEELARVIDGLNEILG
jgi:mRNA interferase MazF